MANLFVYFILSSFLFYFVIWSYKASMMMSVDLLKMKQLVEEEEMKSELMEPAIAARNGSSSISSSSRSLFSFCHYQQMPFLQLLQCAIGGGGEETMEEDEEEAVCLQRQQVLQPLVSDASYHPQSNLELLLQMQSHQQQWRTTAAVAVAEVETASRAVEQLESCVTHASELETRILGSAPASCAPAEEGKVDRKKRKRTRSLSASAGASKSPAEAESQRMTHIAVERNRRRLMNDHLASLRSLMPASFIQRGDQASIIGGAIEFIKKLEHKFLWLQAEKRLRISSTASSSGATVSDCANLSKKPPEDEDSQAVPPLLHDGFFVSPQYTSYSQSLRHHQQLRCPARQLGGDGGVEDAIKKEEGEEGEESEEMTFGVDVEATVGQGHVNLKVAGYRRPGQIVRAIAAMEELRLSVLHLNITSLDRFCVLYAFNLKIEEECKLGSAEEIATAVHQIFSYINACYY